MEKDKKEQKEEKKFITVKIDKKLHTLLKVKASKEEKTLKDFILQILENSVKE